MERPLSVSNPTPSLRHHYARRPREYTASDCGVRVLEDTSNPETAHLSSTLCRLRANSPHFQNIDFRTSCTEYAMRNGTLTYSLEIAQPLRLQHVTKPGGIACGATRRSAVEVLCGVSALDAALDLQSKAHLMKPGLVFVAHPTDKAHAASCCHEEKELLARTNWMTGFIDEDTCTSLKGDHSSSVDVRKTGTQTPCLTAGAPACLLGEHLAVLRSAGQTQLDGDLMKAPRELAAAICFLPRSTGRLQQGVAWEGRTEYRKQVEAALRVCCLMDLDGICVGCTEGIAGSELFGQPLREVAEVWRDVLQDRSLSPSGTPMAAHFKRVVFCTAKSNPFSMKHTDATLRSVLGETLL